MSVIISAAVLASPGLVGQPLTHARIGYNKITGTVIASSNAAGYPASAADNPLTYEYWKAASLPATWEVDSGSGQDVDYIGLAAHTCGDDGATVSAEYWDGLAWQVLATATPTDNRPIMFLFEPVTATKFRVSLTGTTAPRIGVIYIGKVLEMQRGIYGGHTPITLSRSTVIRPTLSERGQFLGRSIIRAGSRGSFSWQNLKAAWYRANFDPFVEAARTTPFFIAWRPSAYPDELAYCWTQEDIAPTNSGGKDFMSVGFSVEGLGIE